MTHTFDNCSHRPDYASEAEHNRDCPGEPTWPAREPEETTWCQVGDEWAGPHGTLIHRRYGVTGAGVEYWGFGPRGSANLTGRKIVRIARTLATVKTALELEGPALEALVKLRAELEAKHPEDRDVWGPYVDAVERAL